MTYASVNNSINAWAHNGVLGECLSKIELPIMRGGMTDLKGSQNGKFHGMITKQAI